MAIIFHPGEFTQLLTEGLGLKSGLILKRKDYQIALNNEWMEELDYSEQYGIRIRSEEYEEIFYHMLTHLGVTKKNYNLFTHHRELREKNKSVENYNEMFLFVIKEIDNEGKKQQKNNSSLKIIDPKNIVHGFAKKFGTKYFPILTEIIDSFNLHMSISPYGNLPDTTHFNDQIELQSLFEEFKKIGEINHFFDQRFIQFISKNPNLLEKINWRKFEELTAEYFHKDGWEVYLEKGTDDDGVDLRVSKEIKSKKQTGIIQCKRVKNGVDKVTVKGLYADLTHMGSDFGIIVTSSHLTPGAKKTIEARKYPIKYAEKNNIIQWIEKMRVPYADEYWNT